MSERGIRINESVLRNMADAELAHYFGDYHDPVIRELCKRLAHHVLEQRDVDALLGKLEAAQQRYHELLERVQEDF